MIIVVVDMYKQYRDKDGKNVSAMIRRMSCTAAWREGNGTTAVKDVT
jgi:hypothetical protein